MKVKVDEITCENSNIIVYFSNDFGGAKAYWDGEKPIAHQEYQVEVDIDNTLDWHKDVLPDNDCKGSIQLKNDSIFISGCIDSIDNDGYTVLRLGDSIIPFLTTGTPFQVGTYATLSVETITLSPVNY